MYYLFKQETKSSTVHILTVDRVQYIMLQGKRKKNGVGI